MLDNLFIDNTALSFHETWWWARIKQKFGWEIISCTFESNEILVYVRKFARCFSLAYVPYPVVHAHNANEYFSKLADFVRTIKPLLPKHCLCIRIDTTVFSKHILTHNEINMLVSFIQRHRGYKGQNVQPPDTVMLNLEQTKEEILQAMKPKWRYNIKLALKKQIVVKESTGEDFEIFWNLYQETAKRDAIATHQKEYYQSVFQNPLAQKETQPLVKLWTAWYQEKPIAAIITVYYTNRATYLYGASSNEHRNLMAPYLLQWSAIQDAKQHGCKWYDLYGIPPDDNPEHPMAGLYRFKTGFGGEIRHYVGCIDFPVHIIPYFLFMLAERFRLWWYKSCKKKIKNILQQKRKISPETKSTDTG